jgi:hypothetical protein
MTRNLKVMGLAVVAALALTAVVASAASAAEFHSSTTNTKITGAQTTTHQFVTDPGTVTCKKATFSGEQAAKTAASITITPSYTECTLATIFGNIAVTVNFNGCDYTFDATGLVHIECPAGKNVVVSGPGCTVTVPAQTVNKVSYSNTGVAGARDIDVNAEASKIKYSYTGFTCGSGSGTENGTYTGLTTVQGSSGDIWWE